MSRKTERNLQVKRKVNEILQDPRFLSQIFRPKPRWIPMFLWKKVVHLVVYQ